MIITHAPHTPKSMTTSVLFRRAASSIIAFACWMGNSATADQFGDFTFTDNGESITITGYPAAFVGAVEIPSSIAGKPVTDIGYEAFAGRYLTSVVIPDSVIRIGPSAFNSCRGLTNVTIGNSVTSIAGGESRGAFASCTSLRNIIIPESVTSIGSYAFFDCRSLEIIVIPDTVTSIGDYVFRDCGRLRSAVIGNGITRIGTWMFQGCESLTSITIPDSVISIGPAAFSGCTNLTSIKIPSSITNIYGSAFQSCRSLKWASFSGDAPTMGSGVFLDYPNIFKPRPPKLWVETGGLIAAKRRKPLESCPQQADSRMGL